MSFYGGRSTESPMDFEWQNSGGPTDSNSPFPKGTPSQNRSFETSAFNSSFLTKESKIAPPFRNPSFTTPRKPFDHLDLFSEASGAESSPADNADGEDTPETKPKAIMPAFTSANSAKQPLFTRYGKEFKGNSPGRLDHRQGKYGNAISQKMRKRKRIDRDQSLVLGPRGSESDSESDEVQKKGRKSKRLQEEPGQSWIGAFFSGIESRPNLPNILSYYAQLAMNVFIVGFVMYLVYTFWTAVRADVDRAAEKAIAVVRTDMAVCAKSFVDNGCGLPSKAPALDAVCTEWEHCMNQDPLAVGRAQVGARTFAEIFNSFVEPISWKATALFVIGIVVAFAMNNMAFKMVRHEVHIPNHQPAHFYPPPPQQSNYQWGQNHLPQTPHHNGGYDFYGNTPYQQVEGGRSPSKGDGRRSPSKGDYSPSKRNRSPSKGDQHMIGY